MLIISCNLLNVVLKVKSKWLSGSRMICKTDGLFTLHDGSADSELGLHCPCPASQRNTGTSLVRGKGPKSKCKVQFLLNEYHFRTIIRSKHLKLHHPTSVRTICGSLLTRSPPLRFQRTEKLLPPILARIIPHSTTTPSTHSFLLPLGTRPLFLQAQGRRKPPPPALHQPTHWLLSDETTRRLSAWSSVRRRAGRERPVRVIN